MKPSAPGTGGCRLCHGRRAGSVLCQACLAQLVDSAIVAPEQIRSYRPREALAGLVDRFGRLHLAARRSVLGRACVDIEIAHVTVSRRHAELRCGEGGWQLTDLGSRNGIAVNRERGSGPLPVSHGDRVAIADVGFLFIADPGTLLGAQPPDVSTSPLDTDDESSSPVAFEAIGLPNWSLKLDERGAWLWDGLEATALTKLQASFLFVLLARVTLDNPFVTTAELLASMSWDARFPDENNVKQLVTRMRARLADTPLSIESRRNLGYRLLYRP
jgi:pSer/pThr/pTyr-binding forkhead associated (FHA) protein